MSFLWMLAIISVILVAFGIVLAVLGHFLYKDTLMYTSIFVTSLLFIFLSIFVVLGIYQTLSLREEQTRQDKEREQIVYQIEHIRPTTDKIKLNEWILTYNDWVNKINAEKETFGWWAWYWDFDMSKHTYIDLV
jgi:uncharacterized membrane protein